MVIWRTWVIFLHMVSFFLHMGHFFCTWCHFFCTWAIFFAHHCNILLFIYLLYFILLKDLYKMKKSTGYIYFLILCLLIFINNIKIFYIFDSFSFYNICTYPDNELWWFYFLWLKYYLFVIFLFFFI